MRWVNQRNTAEVHVNAFEEVFLECHGEPMRRIKDPALSQEYFERLARMLSNSLEIKDFYKTPIIDTKLPGGHRLHMDIGAHVISGIAASVRVATTREFSLSDFNCDEQTSGLLQQAMAAGLNIVISGGTFSGKTQFTNALGKFIPPGLRLLVAEDVEELKLGHVENLVRYIVSRRDTSLHVTYQHIIDGMMRMRPDRIWVGEMSIQNTWGLLRLLNTGHSGLLTTIHADSPADVFHAIERNIQLAGISTVGVREYFMGKIDMIVQIHRNPGTHVREVAEIYKRGDELRPSPTPFPTNLEGIAA